MNCTTYLFGELSNGYTQYPDDSSSINFKKSIRQCTAPSQLVIHRDDDLMYYSYIKRIDNNKYIGFAVVINGYYISQPLTLFPIFEQLVENLIEEGVIINFLSDGRITSSLNTMTQEEETVCATLTQLHQSFETNQSQKKLPPTDFSIAIDSSKLFSIESGEHEIAEASYRFGYTIILKEKDYDSIRVNSWKNTLRTLNEERRTLAIANEQLQQENSRILKQKKQVKNVTILVLVVIACAFGIYFLRENLTNTKDELDHANNTIEELNNTIRLRDNQILDISNKLDQTQQDLTRQRNDYQNLLNDMNELFTNHPIIIEEIQIESHQVKIDFQTNNQSDINITLICLAENSIEKYVDTYSLQTTTGNNSVTLTLSNPLNTSRYYYVLVVYQGQVIGGKRW